MSHKVLRGVLDDASDAEILHLRRLLWDLKDPEASILSRDGILDRLRQLASSMLGAFLRQPPGYREIVQRVLTHLKVRYAEHETLEALEEKLVRKVLQTVWEQLTPQQRAVLEQEIAATAKLWDPVWVRSVVAAGSVFGALTAAQVSGLGVYLAATTALATVPKPIQGRPS